jgi:hypothetical protein
VTSIKRVVWRIGSADAVTWLSFWLTLIGTMIGSLVVTSSGISWPFRLAVVGAGQLILWAPLVIARWLVLRMNPQRRTAIAIIIIGAFVIGATARALAVGLAFTLAFGPETALWLQRAHGSFGTNALIFAITAYAVSSAREQRRRIEELGELQHDLAQSVVAVQVGIEERAQQSVQRVRSVLEAELAALQASHANAGVESLERLARDVVRPLSHELAEAPIASSSPEPRSGTAVSWVRVLDLAAQGKPFNPGVVALLLFVVSLGAVGSLPSATPIFLVIVFAAFLILTLANPVVARVMESRSLRSRLVILILATGLCALGVAVISYFLVRGLPIQQGIVLGAFYFILVFTLGVTVISALGTDRRLIIARMDRDAAELRRNLALVNQVRWFQDRALSRALHGPVQTTISAAALKLDSAMVSGAVTPQLVDQLRRDVARDLDVLSDATRIALPLDEGIAGIIATWDGVCFIEASIDPAVTDLVASDAPLRSCAIAVATEAISNAVRHGKSTRITLSMSLSSAQEVLIEVDSVALQGPARTAPVTAGLGTRQLDECTTWWTLELTPGGQHLKVALPSRLLPVASDAVQPARAVVGLR